MNENTTSSVIDQAHHTLSDALKENLKTFCTNRGTLYGFLARCFERELDEECARQVAQEFSIVSEDKALEKEAQELKDALASINDDTLEQLAVVYNRVFYGMGPRTAQKAFPYESVYTSSGGLMMQNAYSEVKRIYALDGFAKNPEFSEPEDHIAVELAFMSALCKNAVSVIEEGDEAAVTTALDKQLDFLQHHLLNWIEPFIADMQNSAEQGFYWHLAAFTQAFLKDEEDALHEILF